MTRNAIGLSVAAIVLLFPGAARATVNSVVASIAKLTPIGLPAGVHYGYTESSMDVFGTRAVVTAGNFGVGEAEGRAFVFDISNPNAPVQIAELRPSDNEAGNEFGQSVAMTGRYVFVGASGANSDRGAVYMYDLSDPAHITEKKIVAFDAAPTGLFGYDLAVSGNRLIVGSPRYSGGAAAAYVLNFANPNNITQKKLFATAGTIGGNFAEQVDISGNLAIVGHISESTPFSGAGAAHLYDLTNMAQVQQKVLRPTDSYYSAFGERVQIDGGIALVSVTSNPGSVPGPSDGAVWSFKITDFDHIDQVEFGRPLGQSAPFGRGLELSGFRSVLGAFNEDNSRGAVYLYDVSNPLMPAQVERIPAPSAEEVYFGRSLAFEGRNMVVGDALNQALLYHFIPEPPTCTILVFALGALAIFVRRPRGRETVVDDRRFAQCNEDLNFVAA